MTAGLLRPFPRRPIRLAPLATTAPTLLALLALGLLAGAGCGGDSDGSYTKQEEIAILVTPTQVGFSVVPIGQTEQKTLTIRSVGKGGPLVVSKLSFTEGTSGDFSFEAPETISLDPGQEATVVIRYQPSDNELDSGTLRIEHNATGVGDKLVELRALDRRPELLLVPETVQFGPVRADSPASQQVRMQNIGGDAAIVTALTWSVEESSEDFEITEEPEYPLEIAPGGDAFFTVTYTPSGGDADSGWVIATYADAEGKPFEARVRILGYEVVPDIVVSPGAVEFGNVPLGTQHTRLMTIANDGTDTLIVKAPQLDVQHPALSFQDAPAADVTLEPEDSVGFAVRFEPTEAFPFTTDPLARIRIESNDPDEDPVLVPVYGNIEKPEIRVTPEDAIDFGVVAQNFTAERTLTIFNAGQLPLEVSELRLVDAEGALAGEYALEEDADFPPTQAGGGLGVVPPNQSRVLTLTFTNRGPESGEAWASITVVSNDATAPEKTVNLRARRGGAPTCEVLLEPGSYDFGTVPIGGFRDATIRIRNTGSGNCGFNRATISTCSVSWIPGIPSGCSPGSVSEEFSVVGTPIPTPDGIPPGGTADVRIRYEPPTTLSIFDFNEYAGFLQLTIYDPYGPGGNDNLFKVPPDPATGTPQPNLQGRSGISRVSVLPDHIDFGLVTLGCYSETHKVSVYNSGTAPLMVTAIEPGPGCSAEFVIEAPPIPPDGIEVTTASPLIIEVKYHAQTLGEQNCNLIIRSSDTSAPVISVPMTGEGTLESHQIDIFQQVAGQEVDILFVIDDSGSMCEEQDRLRENLEVFINHAQTWGNQYQIGVVSTCVQTEDVCEGAGELKSNFFEAPDWERWVDNDSWPHFTSNCDLGCSGNSDSQEAALEAAHMALSLPISHLSDQPCGSDAQCQAPDKCIPGLAVCGGFNAGFVRPDAALEIVVLSDEEDQSPATPDFYVDFFKSIKGFANENFFHLHSIVGDKDSGCGDTSGSGTGTTAEAGDRYIYVSEATGGVVESICNDDFAAALSDIGAIAFGLKVQFFLSRAGDPATITVSVNGVACEQGWLYDPPSNSVIFEENGVCMPQEGDEIRIEYDAICFTN